MNELLSATYLANQDAVMVSAIVEDSVYIRGSQTSYDPPEYAPALCWATVSSSYFDEDLDLSALSEEQLKEEVLRNEELINFSWIIDEYEHYD